MQTGEFFIKGIANPKNKRIEDEKELPSYFPIRIQYVRNGEYQVCNTPADILDGQSFVVLQLNVIL